MTTNTREPFNEHLEPYFKENVVLFSKSYCPYCKKLKAFLQEHGVALAIFELNEINEGAKIQSLISELSNVRTVPQLFINRKFIGGCDSVLKLASEGELQAQLREAQVSFKE